LLHHKYTIKKITHQINDELFLLRKVNIKPPITFDVNQWNDKGM